MIALTPAQSPQRSATPPPTRAVALSFAEEPGGLLATFDTLKASKILAARRDQGLLISLPARAKRNMAYRKPALPAEEPDLLSEGLDNKPDSA